ncbi:hypothetical protein FJZ21_01165 [Candidatus Pacearchaeota archaeon]|nr:hypothetical protein [Candidatus Pacearchaeota archaeon]
MFSFFSILIKNLHNMFKSKFVISLIVLGPLVLVSLFSFGIIGTGISNIEASFYSEDDGDYRSLFITALESNSFIIAYTDNRGECVQQVLNGNTNVCIILKNDPNGIPLPENINDRNIRNFRKSYGVEVQVDFSKQRVVWGIINKVQAVVDGFSKEIQRIAIEEVTSKFDSSLSQLETLEDNIDFMKSRVDGSKSQIAVTSQEINSFRTNSLNQLNVISNNLNLISPSAMAVYPNQVNEINSALTNLNNALSSNLGTNSLASIESNIDLVSNNIDLIRSRIVSTKDEVEEIKDTISDKGSLSINKFVEPIPLSYSSVTDEAANLYDKNLERSNPLNLVDYLLPSLLSFFIVFTSLMFGSSLVIKERSSNAHIRNYLSKTSSTSFVLGNLSYLIIIIMLQVVILLIFANFFINSSISQNWFSILIYISLGVTVFSILGMVIGYSFNNRDTVILSAVCISLIFIIFSPLINPIETMPETLRTIFSKSPAVIVEQGVSKSLFFNKGIQSIWDIILLPIMAIVLFITSIMLHKFSKERLIKE